MLCRLAMGCAAQRGAACQLFTNKEGSVKPMENKNMSKLVIGVLVVLVLLLGGLYRGIRHGAGRQVRCHGQWQQRRVRSGNAAHI